MYRILLLVVLALASACTWAGETYSSQSNLPLKIGSEAVLPHRGGYWNPAAPGSGYFVDITRRGNGEIYGFATAYTYTATGQSTFLILQGNITFATETQRQQEGWYAKLVSPLYQAADGQPFGGAYRAPIVSASTFGSGELVWKTRRTAELRVGGVVTPIRTLHPDDAATEAAGMLSGTWVIQARMRSAAGGGFERYASHVVKLTPSVPQPTWSTGAGAATIPASALASVWQPPTGVITFTVTCISECFPQGAPPSAGNSLGTIYSGARVWIDPVTLRVGWVQNAVAGGQSGAVANVTQDAQVGAATMAFDLYVDDDTVVGRGAFLIPSGFTGYTPGAYPGSELIMTRITPNGLHAPEGTVVKLY